MLASGSLDPDMGATSRTFGDRAIVTGDGRCRPAPRQRGGEAAPACLCFRREPDGCAARLTCIGLQGHRISGGGLVVIVLEDGFCAAENWRQPAWAEEPAAERRYRLGVGVDSLTSRHGVPTGIRKLP